MSGFLVENNDAGGTNGTTISHANSGGASGSAWDTVTIGSGSTLTYDNSQAHGAGQTLSSKFVVPAGITTYHFWNLTTLTGGSGSTTQLNTRMYFRPGSIGIKRQLHKCLATASNTFVGGIYLDATGHILIEDSTFATKQTSTTVLSASQWYRIECKWVFDASAGIIEVKIFTNPDSLTAAETITQTAMNTSTAFNSCHFGIVNAGASSTTDNMTGFGASNQGAYIGPKAYPVAISGTGAQAAVTVAGTAGTVKVGTGKHIAGVSAAVTVAGTAGVAKAGVKVHGVAAAVTVAGTAGAVKGGAKVHGVAAAVTAAGSPGAVTIGGASVTLGHAAAVTVAGGVGQVKVGIRIHGVAAAVTVAGTVGHAKAGATIHGVAAAVTVAGTVGTTKGGVKVHGVSASMTVAGTAGTLKIGRGIRIQGIAAQVTVVGTQGFPDVPNVAATVTGVAALVSVTGTPGHVFAGVRIVGVHAGVVVDGGIGSPRLTAGHANPLSILDSTKKALGMDPEVEVFDPSILVFLNAALVNLRRIGVAGNSLQVTTRTDLWSTFWPNGLGMGMIQTYVYIYVRLAFDPPSLGFQIKLLQDQLATLTFRLNVLGESINPPSDPETCDASQYS